MTDPVIRGNSLYTVVDGPTWTQAEANAQKLGGHLATLSSKAEDDFIFNTFIKKSSTPTDYSDHLWIGLTDSAQEGTYKWSSGEDLIYNNINPINYSETHAEGRQDWVLYWGQNGTWDTQEHDGYPQTGRKGIAETPIVTRGDSAYAIVQGPTWEEAEANAQKLGGHLVTINDAAENQWLVDQYYGAGKLSENTSSVWIGLTDKAAEGSWVWGSGDSATYSNWGAGEPDGTDFYKSGEEYAEFLLFDSYNRDPGQWGDNSQITGGYGIAEIKITGTTPPTNLNLDDQANTVAVTGSGSGTADGTSFSNIQSIDLKGGDDYATIGTAGSLTGLLNGGSGTDTLNTNYSANNLTINASGAGTVDGTSISNFETINTLAGNDSITVNNSSTALTLNTGEGTDSLTSTNTADTLNVSAANSGTLGSISFSNLENVTLGAGADTATIAAGGALSSLLNLGNGNDVLTIEAGGTLHDIQGGEGDDVAIIKDGGIFDNLDLGRGSDNINFEGVPQFKAVSGGFSDGGIDSIGLGNSAEYLNYLGFAEGRLYLDKQAGLSAFASNSTNYDPTAIYVGDFENFDFAGGDDQLNLRFDDSDITGRSQYPELFDTNTLSFSGGEGYDTLNLDASANGLSDDAKQAIAAYQSAPAGNTLSVAFGGTNYNFADFEEVVVNGVSRGPTFRISLSPTGTVNEGSDLTTTVQTTNLAEGTEIYWSAGGENINSSDFDITGAGLSGKGTVDANAQFLITHKIAADSNTEGDEILQIKLFSDSARTTQVGSTASVTINGDNNNPMVVNDTIAVTEDQAISFNPAGNDTDPDQGDKVRVSAVTQPANSKGEATVNQAGEVTYSAIGKFDSLAQGQTAQESITYTAVDGRGGSSSGTVGVTVTGVNDAPVAIDDTIVVDEDAPLLFNPSGNDPDVDNNDRVSTVSVSNPAGNKGLATLVNGQVQYNPNGAFEDLPAGGLATESFTYEVADSLGAKDQGSVDVTITGVNDTATITANSLPSASPTQNASNILFSETAISGGKAVADTLSVNNAFSISDVDYGEQEFNAESVKQTVSITADGKGTYQQGGNAASRVVGSFALDSSTATNTAAAGAITGTTADLTITDNGTQNGAENGFDSLAAGETATASITLTSEDGTATSTSQVTITGVNDTATITGTSYKKNYTQADFSSTPVITHSDVYKVADVDYGEQEFSSGNYNTSIKVDSGSGRSGLALGGFSIVSDGSNRSGSSTQPDPGSRNDDSADVVIRVDGPSPGGQVFNLAAVLDPSKDYGVQLNNPINGGKGSNGSYDLSDFSLSAPGHGQVEVYRYQTDDDGSIIGGGWSSTDTNALSATDALRLISGINSLAYGETASAKLEDVRSEDGTSSTAATITIAGKNDAPVIDTGKQLKSFELYGTFTVAEMLGFVDPSKTLITDVDYGSMPESIAVTKLTPTGNFADADTGTLQRYNESTKEWEDIDTKNVSDTNKLLLNPSDLLRFNANAEAYVSTALGGGSSKGGGIFNVEFRAWDSAFEAALDNNDAPDKTLFSSGLQTITLALATSGERANATDLTYIPGQAIGIDGSNITVDGELTIQTPVKGSVAGAGSSVYDNAVALVDGTSFGGIHGVGSQNNITSAGSSIINAQAEGLVAVDASNYFDSFDDAIDADATARLGIKSGPVGSGLVANGAYGVRDVDIEVGANLDLTGVVLGKTLATGRSMDGRAHAGSQFSSSAGIANTTAEVAGDMALSAEGGILTTVESFSRNGSAISDSTAAAAYGVVSGLKGSETSFDVGGAFNAEVGLNITMATKATMVGDGVNNNNGFSFDDEVIADTKIGKSFGLGTLDSQLHDLSINVQDTLELDINNTSLLNSEASAVTGDATAKGKMAGNTGIYHANLQAGGAGTIDVSIDSGVNSVAETTTGDSFASAYSLHSVGIESSDFDFQDPHSSLAIKIENNNSASASTKHGSAISHLGSSSAGMLGNTTTDLVRSVESVNALINDYGFSQAAGISGTGAIATADQSAIGISGYTFTTTSTLTMDVTNTVDSQSQAAIVQWG